MMCEREAVGLWVLGSGEVARVMSIQPLIVLLALCVAHAVCDRSINCGMNVDPTNTQFGNPPPKYIAGINATWVRIEFQDGSTGATPQQYPLYDPVVSSYVASGINVLMILDYATYPGSPGTSGTSEQWQAYTKDYAERVADIAAHYGTQVAAYEIWNEEDLADPSPSYDPTINPQECAATLTERSYAFLLEGAYNAVKQNSNSMVVMGGLASGNPGYVSSVLQASNGQLFADAIGLHPYGQRPFPDWPSPDWGFGVLTDLLQNYLNVVNAPIWITEVGTSDMSVQDDFPYQTFLAINEWNPAACPVTLWFCWSDGMVSPFGVIDTNNQPKPSYFSFQSFANQTFVAP